MDSEGPVREFTSISTDTVIVIHFLFGYFTIAKDIREDGQESEQLQQQRGRTTAHLACFDMDWCNPQFLRRRRTKNLRRSNGLNGGKWMRTLVSS